MTNMSAGVDLLKLALALPWKGAEGTYQDRPFLMRFRDVPEALSNGSQCDHLLIATYRYAQEDESGLPSKAQYQSIASFEGRFIDSMEQAALSILVVTRTGGGEVEYHIYSKKESEELLRLMGERLGPDDPVTFSEREDPTWTHYRNIRSRIL
jgi:hypothetical protein